MAKAIIIRTCSDCPYCQWDRGYDAFFCEDGFPVTRLKDRFGPILPNCSLIDHEMPEVDVKVKEYAKW